MDQYQLYQKLVTGLFKLIGGCILLMPISVQAQRSLNYQLQASVNLAKQSFDVKGTLTFLTEPYATDSVKIVLSKTVKPPILELSGAKATMQSSVNATGDIAYTFKFVNKLTAGTRLKLNYQYERGAAPTFQYYIDSIFCMASGYGSAWYPQVISTSADGNAEYTKGTGSITVTTQPYLTAVMAACDVKVSSKANSRIFEFHYTEPDIFSLNLGNYIRHEYKSKIPFYTYTLNSDIDGDNISHNAANVMDFLATQFGPLNIPNFCIVEFPEYIAEKTGIGGASMLGGILMPTDALRKFNYALFGHEIGHQWWGNKINSKGVKGSSMLSEAFAQYGSLQVVNHFDSTNVVNYRKRGYPGYINDQCGLGYLKNAAAGNDEPLSKLSGSNEHMIGDSKGFLVLELLSRTVGKVQFNKALHTINAKYSRTGLTWDNFLSEIDTVNGSNLQWFYQQWFERTGAPSWQTSWQQQQQSELQLIIIQTDSVYRLPLEVLIVYNNGTTSLQKININEKVSKVKLPVTASVKSVTIDPDFKVIHWADDLTPIALDLGKVQQVIKLRMEQKNDEAVNLALSFIKAGIPSDKFGLEFSLFYYLGRITFNQNKTTEALAYYQRALKCVTRNADLLAYTYYRIAMIAVIQKDSALSQWAGDNAVKADAMNHNFDSMSSKIAQLKIER
ncbi:M1 family aminopeptidase [Mucilaginibacter sp. SP1R1]|uniref:M1 family aminopeptidase n=1 Tax=Mucilaginibacter sp. SP1R1 TaxID=2723091 RepID=UPI00160C126C|nr:M1 family aminopeptidase [Mucilaginibacter sp. SP1R1]MBB6147953.1 hypothetical protein [Mucilaginibacter sp. SP1R1]